MDSNSDAPLLSSLLTRPQTHPPSHLPSSPSLHAPSHPLPSHAAAFPTSLSHHHHHPSHHHITNGNSLLPHSPDSAHLRSHQHHTVTATGSIATQTSTVTTVTSGITTTTTGGNDPPISMTSSSKPQERELPVSLAGDLGRVSGTRREDTGTSSSQKELDDFFGTLTPLSSLPPPPPPPTTQPPRTDRYTIITHTHIF